jgi:hypothetical protein
MHHSLIPGQIDFDANITNYTQNSTSSTGNAKIYSDSVAAERLYLTDCANVTAISAFGDSFSRLMAPMRRKRYRT